MIKNIAVALLFGALALSPGLSLAGGGSGVSLEQIVVEMASTPEQHAALARYYHGKAEEARAEAQRHERMGSSYHRGNLGSRSRMKRHCGDLSDKYEGVASDYDAMAKLHEEEAKK